MELTQLAFNGLQQQCLLLGGKRWRKYVVLPYTILADPGKNKTKQPFYSWPLTKKLNRSVICWRYVTTYSYLQRIFLFLFFFWFICSNEWFSHCWEFLSELNCKAGKACGIYLAAQPSFVSPNAAIRLVRKNSGRSSSSLSSMPKMLPPQPVTGKQLLKWNKLTEQVKSKNAKRTASHWIKLEWKERSRKEEQSNSKFRCSAAQGSPEAHSPRF